MRVRTWTVFFLVIVASVAGGCRAEAPSPLVTSLQQITAGAPLLPVDDAVWEDVRAFYEQRLGEPAWVDEGDKDTAKAAKALDVLRTATRHGFAPADYGEPQIAGRIQARGELKDDTPDAARQLAELDARLTTALLALGRDVAVGRTSPRSIDWQWTSRRQAPDLAGTLAQAAGGDLERWLDAIRPQHPEYAALEDALVNLLGQRDHGGGWTAVPAGRFAAGRSHPAVIALRQRLLAGGHLSAAAASSTSPVYSTDDETAVRAFQNLHALPATGIADRATLAAMNVPIDDRIRQVAVNLERWRWMPDDLGARHLLVNIPYYHLIARENGKAVKDIRVVVGTTTNKTPTFSSEMSTAVFSPYWNIPDSIVEGETAPAVARDPAYLAKNNIEILDVSDSGRPVDHSSVDWDDADQLKRLAFRQRPGPDNALGHVKFLFPNEFDVYLHDTPADKLFARPGRAFSHGCIRVEEPEALAQYILRGYPEWDDASIHEAMHSGVEQHVKLEETIPVHIVYFTAWVDDQGGLHFQPDVYGYDADQAAASR
jgi:murein L,D-transpeptidase YcbB/YkuD